MPQVYKTSFCYLVSAHMDFKEIRQVTGANLKGKKVVSYPPLKLALKSFIFELKY